MFFLRRPLSAPDKIYSSCLATLHEGHALWYPEPHESGEPQIGDVGFIHRGAFIRLFNLDTSSPEKKVVFWPTPFEDIEPLPPHVLQIDRRHRPLVPDHYCSHGVESKEVHGSADITTGVNISASFSAQYACRAAQGAVLVLKSEAHAEAIFENRALKKYIIRNHHKWCAYVKNVLFQDIEPEDIVVVSGWVKTEDDWAAVAFSNVSASISASTGGHASGIARVEVGGSHASSTIGPKMQRQGRKYLASTPNAPQTELKRDQCVLLKRYMLRRRLRVLRKVVAGAGYHRLPDSGDARRSSGEEGVLAREVEDSDEESTSELYGEGEVSDPLDILLDYILEVSDVEVAIASDGDIESIVGGKQVIDFASYLRRVQPPVEVDGAVGSLCIEDVISHERDRALAHRIISSSDLAEWADITLDGAGHLEDGHVFINPTGEGDRPFKLKRLAFSDSRRPTRDCQCSALSTDDKLLAASFGSNDVLVWRLSDGLLVQRLHYQGHTDETTSLSFSPDNSTIASGSGDGAVIVWNVRRGRVLLRPEGHEGAVKSIVYAPHGGLIATCSFSPDYSARISDSSTGARLHTFHVGQRILDIAFSPDGSRFHITLENSRRIYDIQTYTHIATLAHPAMSPIYSSISCQGDRVATVSDDGQVKIWNAATGRELLAITHPKALSHSVSFSPDGVEVVAASPDSTEAVAAFLDDAAKPVEATHDTPRTAMAYDSRTGQLRRVYSLSDGAYKSSGSVSCVAYSPNGDYVVLGTTYGPFQVCDAKSGTPLAKFEEKGRRGYLQEARFLSDGHTLLTQFSRGPILLCNVKDVSRLR